MNLVMHPTIVGILNTRFVLHIHALTYFFISFRGTKKRNSSGSSDEEESSYADSDVSDAEIDGIDEEEVNGLLGEANVTDKSKLANNKERSLRKKRGSKALEIIASKDEDNKGRKVAKVFRGIVYPGE